MNCIEQNVVSNWLEEYRRIAAMSTSIERRDHYLRTSEHYTALAEELGVESSGPG
jgi:hypothetical protein